jgi:2-dehydro-3-deoxygluconokinase
VSCDLNYRSKLWKWGKTAREVMSELVRYVDVVIGNDFNADKFFGIKAHNVDIATGEVDAEKYLFVAKRLKEEFPNLKKVAITLRGSISASHNTWSGVLYDGETFYKAPVYQITHIVERTGGGDAFTGGLIYGLLTFGNDLQKVLNFAVAASCLKHTIPGVYNITTIEEVERLMEGVVSGIIQR